MSLRFRAQLAARGFDAELDLGDGQQVAVMGPNGAGKSTLLGLIAGSLHADSGEAILDGVRLFGPHTWLPPHARSVALLAQDPLLFPHMTVLDNVAFGPRVAGLPRAAARDKAAEWLAAVEASDFAPRKATELSGGEAQRVALARALAAEPKLLLLDEPLSAIDVDTAPLLRNTLAKVLRGRSLLMVTHDLQDALALSDRVVVFDRGKVAKDGPPGQILG
ncbi:MAG: ATP-binding cassette domain-containing protein [Propionibacteriaceae bacterium]|jgi:molybdate transport system ATP-binding protein|nr:ATP-binding cassette domain-containing protein [Propionibacteriaceae bacterium]